MIEKVLDKALAAKLRIAADLTGRRSQLALAGSTTVDTSDCMADLSQVCLSQRSEVFDSVLPHLIKRGAKPTHSKQTAGLVVEAWKSVSALAASLSREYVPERPPLFSFDYRPWYPYGFANKEAGFAAIRRHLGRSNGKEVSRRTRTQFIAFAVHEFWHVMPKSVFVSEAARAGASNTRPATMCRHGLTSYRARPRPELPIGFSLLALEETATSLAEARVYVSKGASPVESEISQGVELDPKCRYSQTLNSVLQKLGKNSYEIEDSPATFVSLVSRDHIDKDGGLYRSIYSTIVPQVLRLFMAATGQAEGSTGELILRSHLLSDHRSLLKPLRQYCDEDFKLLVRILSPRSIGCGEILTLELTVTALLLQTYMDIREGKSKMPKAAFREVAHEACEALLRLSDTTLSERILSSLAQGMFIYPVEVRRRIEEGEWSPKFILPLLQAGLWHTANTAKRVYPLLVERYLEGIAHLTNGDQVDAGLYCDARKAAALAISDTNAFNICNDLESLRRRVPKEQLEIGGDIEELRLEPVLRRLVNNSGTFALRFVIEAFNLDTDHFAKPRWMPYLRRLSAQRSLNENEGTRLTPEEYQRALIEKDLEALEENDGLVHSVHFKTKVNSNLTVEQAARACSMLKKISTSTWTFGDDAHHLLGLDSTPRFDASLAQGQSPSSDLREVISLIDGALTQDFDFVGLDSSKFGTSLAAGLLNFRLESGRSAGGLFPFKNATEFNQFAAAKQLRKISPLHFRWSGADIDEIAALLDHSRAAVWGICQRWHSSSDRRLNEQLLEQIRPNDYVLLTSRAGRPRDLDLNALSPVEPTQRWLATGAEALELHPSHWELFRHYNPKTKILRVGMTIGTPSDLLKSRGVREGDRLILVDEFAPCGAHSLTSSILREAVAVATIECDGWLYSLGKY